MVQKDSKSQCECRGIVIKADMWIVDWCWPCIDCLNSVQVVSPFMGSSLVPCIDPTLFEDLGHSTFVPSLICSPVSDTLLFPTWLGHRQEAYELRLPDIKDVESRRPCSFFSMHHAGDIE